jgi:transcriptional regulator GlxA family with amidase domain
MTHTEVKPAVAILLFDDVEVLDFAGPYEVLAEAKAESGDRYLNVFTVAPSNTIRCSGGLRVLPDWTIADCPSCDVLIVPGGPGAREKRPGQEPVVEFIRQRSAQTKLIASVCTGAFLLGRAGLLHQRTATTHTRRIALMAEEFPNTRVVVEKLVDEGSIITAAGVSSGIDLALYLLEKWFGADVRRREAQRLDGPWT